MVMVEKFVDTETDRTKSRWVAKAFKEFARPKTTNRSLFYYALQREQNDYPICGGFVGEIRINRRYHWSDGERLPKWVERARLLGFIPADSILDESPGEHVFLPEPSSRTGDESIAGSRQEVWINKSSLNPLLLPVCSKRHAALVSVENRPASGTIDDLIKRSDRSKTIILCLSDLSPSGFSFCRDLESRIAQEKDGVGDADIKVKQIGLTPNQITDFKIPMVPLLSGVEDKSTKEEQKGYKNYLKPFGLDSRLVAELDALEVHYPGGIAGFLDKALSEI